MLVKNYVKKAAVVGIAAVAGISLFACKKAEAPVPKADIRIDVDANLGDGTILTKTYVFKRLKIKKGEFVADWFIPYRELENATDPSMMIDFGKEMVKKKFDESEYEMRFIRIYHNFELASSIGVYIIGTN